MKRRRQQKARTRPRATPCKIRTLLLLLLLWSRPAFTALFQRPTFHVSLIMQMTLPQFTCTHECVSCMELLSAGTQPPINRRRARAAEWFGMQRNIVRAVCMGICGCPRKLANAENAAAAARHTHTALWLGEIFILPFWYAAMHVIKVQTIGFFCLGRWVPGDFDGFV